jgi:alanine racemase
MRKLTIDLGNLASNLATVRKLVNDQSPVKIMGVVKANAYGHGMLEVAKRLEQEGIDFLGVADLDEAIALRSAGIGSRILAWLHDPQDDFVFAVKHDIDLAVSSSDQLLRIIRAGESLGKPARIHIKVDTGLGRNGVTLHELDQLLAEVKTAVDNQQVIATGFFSHLSSTGVEEDLVQIAKFDEALESAAAKGLSFEVRHLTASDGTLSYPQARYDMVRIGVSLYGLSPFSDNRAKEFGLKPVMKASATVVQTKRVPAGSGVSYGYLYRTERETTLALVPVGYAEGIPRNASTKAKVLINGREFTIQSRIAMDQFVIDVGDASVTPGDEVILFGTDQLTADDLANAAETINYEIVTRMGGRFIREYIG